MKKRERKEERGMVRRKDAVAEPAAVDPHRGCTDPINPTGPQRSVRFLQTFSKTPLMLSTVLEGAKL